MQVSQHKNFMWECSIDHPMIEKQLKSYLRASMSEFISTFVLLGEFNIDFLNQEHPLFSKLLYIMNSFDLTQVVSCPTHVSHNGKETLIVLALILSSSKLKECSVIPPLSNSDHDGVHLVLRMLPSIQKTTNNGALTIWRYSQADFTKANAIIHSKDWSDIYRESHVQNMESVVQEVYGNHDNMYYPKRPLWQPP